MPIKWAPPWLKKLGSDAGPLQDDADIQRQMARMKVDYEREERQQAGALFAGPVEPRQSQIETPPAVGDILATGEASDAGSPPPPMDVPVSPTTAPTPPAGFALPPVATPPTPNSLGGMADAPPVPSFIAPPSAPPPPPPADRPTGTFRFEPNKYPKKRPDEEVGPGAIRQ